MFKTTSKLWSSSQLFPFLFLCSQNYFENMKKFHHFLFAFILEIIFSLHWSAESHSKSSTNDILYIYNMEILYVYRDVFTFLFFIHLFSCAGSLIFVVACGIFSFSMCDLVPWWGIKSRLPPLGVQSLSHRTIKEHPYWHIYIYIYIYIYLNLIWKSSALVLGLTIKQTGWFNTVCAQSGLTLCDLMDGSSSGSSVHGIF